MLLCVPVLQRGFVWLSGIPLNACAMACSPVLLVMGIWVVTSWDGCDYSCTSLAFLWVYVLIFFYKYLSVRFCIHQCSKKCD